LSIAYFLAKRIHFSKGDDSQRVSPPAIRIAISGVAIGVAVMLITVAIVVGFKEEVRQKVIDFSGHLQMQAFVSSLPAVRVRLFCPTSWMITLSAASTRMQGSVSLVMVTLSRTR
jgi:lipoprotein-releasing system permease protein